MSLSIEVRSDNGAVVVALAGTADASTLELLRDPLSVALADARVLVLELDRVTPLDAAALRDVLVGILLDTACGGHLHIAASHKATVASLAAARIHQLVSVQPSLADALAEDHDEVCPVTNPATPVPDEPRPAFDLPDTAIPVVRCRPCGRLHLPARLWPVTIKPRQGGGEVVELRCVCCNTVGSLLLDPESTEHRCLLALWRDAAEGEVSPDETKASR